MRRPSEHSLVLLLILAACLAPAPVAGQERDLEWIDRRALLAGEVVVETDRQRAPGHVDLRAAVLIDAPPEAIWDVLTACETSPEYVPNIVRCQLLETLEEGRAQVFAQTVRSVFFLPRFEHVFRLDYQPYSRIDVRGVSGPLEHLEGRWLLLEEEDRILLIHELELDPGMPVPRFMVRGRLRRDVPEALRGVRERAEAAAGQR
jgi:ribosome-associated toxin RatA of RatAB toxin-antitoxin module